MQVDKSLHKRKCSKKDKILSKEKGRKWSGSHVIKKSSSIMKGESKQRSLEKSNLEKRCLVREM